MKTEPKTFASLSSGLLARKGAARPAMRPQGFGARVAGGGLEDLGWDDMGFEPPRAALSPVRDADHDAFGDELSEPPLRSPLAGLTPVGSPVHGQQAEIADRFEADCGESGEDALDETAELYQPDAEAVPTPAVIVAHPASVSAPRRAPRPRAAPGAKSKAAFTLRLDTARHLKLRLACAVNGSSAQVLVTEALDAFLAGMPELDAMVAKANRKG